MIFQDPYSSLNPRYVGGDIVGEPLARPRHRGYSRAGACEKVEQLLERVGLTGADT
jgi:ABC-type microcin C transport system duplicated ATPase subunit YejF